MEEKLCKIRDIYRAIAEYEISFEKKFGLGLNDGMVLCSLSKTDQLSSGEIAGLLGLTTSNTSKIICSVEEKGLIQRTTGSKDKRQMYFSLTPKGEKLLKSIKSNPPVMPELLQGILESHS